MDAALAPAPLAPATELPAAEIVGTCRRMLADLMRHDLPPQRAAATFDLPPFERLDVDLRTRGVLRASTSGAGESAQAQLADAVTHACSDTRFDRVVACDLADLSVEIWLQTGSDFVPPARREHAFDFLSGRCGAEIEWADAHASFKPSMALERSFKRPADYLDALCEHAGVFAGAWRESACSVRRTQWRHLCEDTRGGHVELRGLRRTLAEPPGDAVLRGWIDEGLTYLANNQQSDGDYGYLYYPLTGRGGAGKSNSVRSSGCAYAMAHAVHACSPALEATAQRSAERAIAGILDRCEPRGGTGLIVPEPGSSAQNPGKLGSTALLALATLAPSMRDRFAAQVPRLLASLFSAQNEDGQFGCYFDSDRIPGAAVDYYPGEALLALVHAAEAGMSGCLDACRRAFAPYRRHFREAPSTAFVGWHADAWSRVTRLGGDGDHAAFVFEQIDWLLQRQNLADASAPDHGGFRVAGGRSNVSSTVFAEATIRAAQLARELGDGERWRRYRTCALAALRFCAGLRIVREQSAFFPHPQRAIGGVTGNLVRFEVRADHVQHLMTMAMAALQTRDLLARV